jgi:hypothetical protein
MSELREVLFSLAGVFCILHTIHFRDTVLLQKDAVFSSNGHCSVLVCWTKISTAALA